jgi:DNA-binding transcriptional regulator GbsR (MarR family)
LAALGVIGGEYATSNEVDNAINNKAPATVKKVAKNKDSSTEELLSDEDQKKLEKAITDFTPVISERNRIVNNVKELNDYLIGKKESRDVIKNLDPHTYEVISEKITAIRKQFKSEQGS